MPIDATAENFDEHAMQGNVLIDFWGPRCQPCLQMMPKILEIEAAAEGALTVLKVNAPENRELCRRLGVMGLPTYVFWQDGHEVDRLAGNPTESDIATTAARLYQGGDS
jgi:thioredoxin 1